MAGSPAGMRPDGGMLPNEPQGSFGSRAEPLCGVNIVASCETNLNLHRVCLRAPADDNGHREVRALARPRRQMSARTFLLSSR